MALIVVTSMGPINAYKDILDNMFSPIDQVVMNQKNQTQTNGIWGHVRYTGGLLALKLLIVVEVIVTIVLL
jgi:hypothetical protein